MPLLVQKVLQAKMRVLKLRARLSTGLLVCAQDGVCTAIDCHQASEEGRAARLCGDAWRIEIDWVNELSQLVEDSVSRTGIVFQREWVDDSHVSGTN